jgi:hypothetical protein
MTTKERFLEALAMMTTKEEFEQFLESLAKWHRRMEIFDVIIDHAIDTSTRTPEKLDADTLARFRTFTIAACRAYRRPFPSDTQLDEIILDWANYHKLPVEPAVRVAIEAASKVARDE